MALLRAYVGEYDNCNGKPAYECIVEAALKAGLAGATVLRGKIGFGMHSRQRHAVAVLATHAAPVVVEIIDEEEKLTAFLPALEPFIDGGMVTIENVRVLIPRRG
jgi:PII-like signaling protein